MKRFTSGVMILGVCTLTPVAAAQGEQRVFDMGVANDTLVEWIEVSWRMRTDGDGPGYAVALCDAKRYAEALPAIEDWSEPNAPGVLAVAFDTDNPAPTAEAKQPRDDRPPMAWFDERGNYYDRPQREVSVHADGRERINTLCRVDYTTGEWIDATMRVRYEAGAGFVTLILDGEIALRDEILPGLTPGTTRLLFGGPAEFMTDSIDLGDEPVRTGAVIGAFPDPVRVTVFDDQFLHAGDQRPVVTANFKAIPERTARVVATLTLDEPECGYDHWDKKGLIALRLPDGEGGVEKHEVFRYITPFRRGWTWYADVTDLLPLFEGDREFENWIETYMKGWLVSFTLDFYPGEPELEPLSVVGLWDGTPEIGNPEKPSSDFFVDRTVPVPEGSTHAFVRVTATGHGMSPNTGNAGEFMALGRTLTVTSDTGGTITSTDPLWKTDVYLNPCRPQGGTWKFDRAGWAPGDVVLPWRVDVSTLVEPGGALTIGYALDAYLNEGRGQTWAPHHWTSAHVVFMRAQ